MIVILKLAKALVGHILSGVGDADHRACAPGEIGVLLCQNRDLLAGLTIQMVRKPRDAEDRIAEMTKLPGDEISPPPRRSKTWTSGLTPSIPAQLLPIIVDALIRQTEPPFTERVMRTKVSSRFKLPTQLGVYEGKTDPMDHLDLYNNLMALQGYSDEVM